MKFGETSDWVQFLGSFDGKQDCIMGHEFVTRIEELGDGVESPTSIDGEPLAVGDRVVSLCRVADPEAEGGIGGMGYDNKFPGGFAEWMLQSPEYCVKVPPHVSDAEAALTEPMAVGYHAVIKGGITAADVPIVIGCGPVGLAIIVALKAAGFGPIIAADFAEGRRELATANGADVVVDPSEGEPHSAALEAWALAAARKEGAAAAPKVFECVGVNDMIGGLMEAVPANTHIIVVGVCMLVDKFRPTTAVVKEREHAHSRLQSSLR